jgi:hypothetical protein
MCSWRSARIFISSYFLFNSGAHQPRLEESTIPLSKTSSKSEDIDRVQVEIKDPHVYCCLSLVDWFLESK